MKPAPKPPVRETPPTYRDDAMDAMTYMIQAALYGLYAHGRFKLPREPKNHKPGGMRWPGVNCRHELILHGDLIVLPNVPAYDECGAPIVLRFISPTPPVGERAPQE